MSFFAFLKDFIKPCTKKATSRKAFHMVLALF